MKRKTTKSLITIAILIVSLAILCACDLSTLIPGATHEHEWSEWETVKDPDCETPGTKERICDCGETQSGSIPVKGHSYSEWIAEIPATCKAEGTLGHYHCSECNQNFDMDKKVLESIIIAKEDHKESDWIEDEESTCIAKGSRHKECTVCKTVLETDNTDMSDHSYGEWIEEVSATYEKEGTLGHYHCSVCNKNFDADKRELNSIVIPKLDPQNPPTPHQHTESDWIVDEEATCVKEGSKHKECTECGKVLATEKVDATGIHQESDWIEDEEATYEKTGLEHTECIWCHVKIKENIIPVLKTVYHNVYFEWFGIQENYSIVFAQHTGIDELPVIEKIGYAQGYWYDKSGNAISDIPAETSTDVYLYAKLGEPIVYKITYDLGNANNHPNNVDGNLPYKTYTIESNTFTLASPTLQGFHFIGWIDENGNIIKQVTEGSTGNLHLTPKWSGVTSSITPYLQISSPMYDGEVITENNGKIVYIYYLGYIANVPTGNADSEYHYYNGTGTTTLSITSCNSTTKSTTTYGKIINNITTSLEQGVKQTLEQKIEANAGVNIYEVVDIGISASTSGSIETHTTLGMSIESVHESGQDIVRSELNSEETFKSYELSPANNPEGYYWYTVYATVDVFALLEYDPTTRTVTYDTARVWRDTYTTGWAYAYTHDEICTAKISGDYSDFYFEIPDKFFNDISELVTGTNGLIYTESGNDCIVTAYEGTDTDVIIPTYHFGKKVTSISSDLFSSNTGITSVTFGKGITSIPDHAFENCTSLTSVLFKGEVTSIGEYAFTGCKSLKINLPNTIHNIGDHAFEGCESIECISIDDNMISLGSNAFLNCNQLTLNVRTDNLFFIQTAISSGASSICVDWICSEVEIDADNHTITVPSIKAFTFNGNGQKFEDLFIVSQSQITDIRYVTIENKIANKHVITTSSPTVKLRLVTIESYDGALLLNSEYTNLLIGGIVKLSANGGALRLYTDGSNGINAINLDITPFDGESATLNVIGGYGVQGGIGINASKTVTIHDYVTVIAEGGVGTIGLTYGENGGNGGIGIKCESLVVMSNATVNATGGDGGHGTEGLYGSDGNNSWGGDRGDDGNPGGNGGNGAAAIHCDSITVDKTSNITVKAGNGGNGGKGGDGGNGTRDNNPWSDGSNIGGNGGNGGNGGSCSQALIANTQNIEVEIIIQEGSVGLGGVGGNGGNGGAGNSDAFIGGQGGVGGSGGTGGLNGDGITHAANGKDGERG